MSVWWEKRGRERKRERSELILLAVCLVIWFSLIFRLLSLVVVTDAVSGLTTAIFTFKHCPPPPLWYIRVWAWHINKISLYVSPQLTKSSNVSAYEIPHSDIAPEKHTTAVPAPNKWPTLHINTHLHAGKFQGSFIVFFFVFFFQFPAQTLLVLSAPWLLSSS